MYINIIFPTLVGIEPNFLSESENKDLLDKCYSLSEKISLQHEAWGSKDKSPLNSFHSYRMDKDIQFNSFFNKINNFVNEFAQINEDHRQYLCSHSWFNIYSNQSYQEPHYHPSATYSAVYYAKTPENCGQFVLMNPSYDEMTEGSIAFASTHFWNYTPEERTIIVFRSSIAHHVLHGNNSEDRVSIAANYSLTPESYKKTIGFYE